ncbi:MAG TPA: GntR family transcriptional regulator [Phycisphaerae bacterium]|nr:GntR family transcriptional regulator [Phycisphaerae bacterium]HOI55164.1 GntR family transcriptional regulator [Phycisphaerae bacterium]
MPPRGRPRIVEEVLHRLLRNLADGVWASGTTLPPSRRLAALFGVSPVTIRRAIADASRLGLLDVRQRHPVVVRKDAAKHAVQWMAERAAGRRTEHVAVLLPESYFPLTRNTVYMLLTTALTRELNRVGFSKATIVPWPMAGRMSMVRSLPHKGYDAAIIIGSEAEHVSSLYLLYEQGFPFVMFNRQMPGIALPSVLVDRPGVTAVIAARLTTLGHRNLCLVAHAAGTATRESDRGQVVFTWLSCLEKAGVLDECFLPVYFAYSRDKECFMPGFVEMMHGPRRPTAIVFEEYQWAAAFLRDPRLADLRVPEQVSLVMLGPTRRVPSTRWAPQLTTADMDYDRAAQCLVETLQRVIAGDKDATSVRLPLTLTMTESVGPPPGS